MPNFTIYDNEGNVKRGGYCLGDDALARMQAQPDELVLIGVTGHIGVHRVNLSDPVNPFLEPIPAPQKTLAELKADAKASVASRRWEIETGGIPFGGGALPSDDRSKVLLASAAEQARRNPAFTVNWKLSDGSWAPLNAATIIAASEAVLDWVSDCFAREKVLCDQIDAASNAEAVDALKPSINTFWP